MRFWCQPTPILPPFFPSQAWDWFLILVEPNPETLQIDENLIESNISYKTKGIMLVHLYGKLSWTERIQEICKENDLLIFEDNAQAFGCGYVNSSAREAIRRKLNQEDENITYQIR